MGIDEYRLGRYIESYDRNLSKYLNEKSVGCAKRLVFFGVRIINTLSREQGISIEELKQRIQFASSVRSMMASLTPGQFLTIYPVNKTYDGKKYQCKDYFSTMKSLESYDPDEEIGIDRLDDFLWEYNSREVGRFVVAFVCMIDRARMTEGRPSMINEFFQLDKLPTYRKFKGIDGKEYFMESGTGKIIKTAKRRPRYLRVIK